MPPLSVQIDPTQLASLITAFSAVVVPPPPKTPADPVLVGALAALTKAMEAASKESKSDHKSPLGSVLNRGSFSSGSFTPEDIASYLKKISFLKRISEKNKEIGVLESQIEKRRVLLEKARLSGSTKAIRTLEQSIDNKLKLLSDLSISKNLTEEEEELQKIQERYEEINSLTGKYSKELAEIHAKKYLLQQKTEIADATQALKVQTELWEKHHAELAKNMKDSRKIEEQQALLNKRMEAYKQGYSTISGSLVNVLQSSRSLGKEGGKFQKAISGAQNATVAMAGTMSSLASTAGVLGAKESWSQAAHFQKNTVQLGTAMGGMANNSHEVTKSLQAGALEVSKYTEGFVSALEASEQQKQLFQLGIKDIKVQNELMKATANAAAELNMSFGEVAGNAGEIAFNLKLSGSQASSLVRSVSNIARQFGLSGQRVWDLVKSSGQFLENMKKTGVSSASVIKNVVELKASLERARGAAEFGDAFAESITKGGIEAFETIQEKFGTIGTVARASMSGKSIQELMVGDLSDKGQIEFLNGLQTSLARLLNTSVSYQGQMTNQAVRGNEMILRNIIAIGKAKDAIDIDTQIKKTQDLKQELDKVADFKIKKDKQKELDEVLNNMGNSVESKFSDVQKKLKESLEGIQSTDVEAVKAGKALLDTVDFSKFTSDYEKYAKALEETGKKVPAALSKDYQALKDTLDTVTDAQGKIVRFKPKKGAEKAALEAAEKFGKGLTAPQEKVSADLASKATESAIEKARMGVNQAQTAIMNAQLDVLNLINGKLTSWFVKWVSIATVSLGTLNAIKPVLTGLKWVAKKLGLDAIVKEFFTKTLPKVVWPAIKTLAQNVGSAIMRFFTTTLPKVVWPAIKTLAQNVGSAIMRFLTTTLPKVVWPAIRALASRIGSAIAKFIVEMIPKLLSTAVKYVCTLLGGVLAAPVSMIIAIPAMIVAAVASIYLSVKYWTTLIKVVGNKFFVMMSPLAQIARGIGWLAGYWNDIPGLFKLGWTKVKQSFSDGANNIKRAFSYVKDKVSYIKDLLLETFNDYIITPVKSFAEKFIPDEILNKIKSAAEKFANLLESLANTRVGKWISGSDKEEAAVTSPPPKMHEGGMVIPDKSFDTKTDEVIRTLHVGERVLSRDETKGLNMKPTSPEVGGSQVPIVNVSSPKVSAGNNVQDLSELNEINRRQAETLLDIRNLLKPTQRPRQISGADASKTAPRPNGSRTMTTGSSYTSEGSWVYAGNANPATANVNPSMP